MSGNRWMNIRERLSRDSVQTPWLFIKTVLRGITAVLALISLSFFAVAIPLWNRNLEHINGPNKGDWQDGVPIAPLAVAFLYNTFTSIYAVRTAKRVPYVLELIMDFVIWAALVPALVFAIWGGVFNVWQTATTTMDPNSSMMMVMCDVSTNFWSRECFPDLYPMGLLEIGAIAFGVPVWIFHTFLFVHGIIERCTRSRRVNSRASEMIKNLEADNGMNNAGWGRPGMNPGPYRFY
ncbi:hypothetical protein TMatcc_003621 [Talaromyces marneffei ATCC 18224]|nr:uncharacterized protein EYB26_001351 [Talaromyces marneffei]QGA13701.1 hypothetical protein EYB26_001351 [Talaromyces marneffei]